MEIQSALGGVATIIFLNKATTETVCWVCENAKARTEAEAHLATLDHIEILSSGMSLVVKEGEHATKPTTPVRAPDVTKLHVGFCTYGNSGARNLSVAAVVKESADHGNLLAMVEDSGSESVYVEVAQWCPKRRAWFRRYFEKMMDSCWDEAGFESEGQAAEALAAWVNMAQPHIAWNQYPKLIACLPDYEPPAS